LDEVFPVPLEDPRREARIDLKDIMDPIIIADVLEPVGFLLVLGAWGRFQKSLGV